MNERDVVPRIFVNCIHVAAYAKREYGRLLWRVPEYRDRLLRHWQDPRHPHAERFARYEPEVRRILKSSQGSDGQLDAERRKRDLSLRVLVKEIPSAFGSFF